MPAYYKGKRGKSRKMHYQKLNTLDIFNDMDKVAKKLQYNDKSIWLLHFMHTKAKIVILIHSIEFKNNPLHMISTKIHFQGL